jgi:excisionase family DNA binding protein
VKSITLHVSMTFDSDSLVELLARGVAQGTMQSAQSARQVPNMPKTTPLEVPQKAMVAGRAPPADDGLLIDTREASRLLKVSSRTIWGMSHSGRMPSPIKIGKAVRWNRVELQDWVHAGCPPQEKWVWPK